MAIFLFFFFLSPCLSTEKIDTKSVYISASIGENEVTINGYTSPESRVELTSSRVYALTFADSTGYYEFKKTLLPKNPSDLCLIATDDAGRHSSPVCIPPPPATNYHTNIGPIILPPTISVDADNIRPGSTALASGQSLKNSPIEIYFYKVNDKAPAFAKAAHAYSLPVFQSISDNSGNFSFNLPTAYSSNYRLFATVKYQDDSSPKSNTLTYALPSLWYLFWLQYNRLIVLSILFFFTLIIFFYLLFQSRHRPRYLPYLYAKQLSTFDF